MVSILEKHKEYERGETVLNNILRTASEKKSRDIDIPEEDIILRPARNSFKAGWIDKAIERYQQYLAIIHKDYKVRSKFANLLHDISQYSHTEKHYEILFEVTGLQK